MTTPGIPPLDIPLLDIALWRNGTPRQRERLAGAAGRQARPLGRALPEGGGDIVDCRPGGVGVESASGLQDHVAE